MANIGHMAALTLAAASGLGALSPLEPASSRRYVDPEPFARNPPDRLSADIDSPFHDKCASNVDVFFNGVKMPNNVQEYCVSEGWVDIRQRNGKGRFMLDIQGNHIVKREHGKVEPTWRRKPIVPSAEELARQREQLAASSERTQSAAEAKRARKMAKAAALAART